MDLYLFIFMARGRFPVQWAMLWTEPSAKSKLSARYQNEERMFHNLYLVYPVVHASSFWHGFKVFTFLPLSII